MNSKLAGWTLVVLLLSPLCAAAEVRTWTDKQGQTTRGEFVRVHEGRVVLKVGTKTLQVPLAQFSPQDQEYIEEQVNRKASKGGDGNSQPIRTWTDARGNQILAAFSRMEETQVVLSESGRLRTIAFLEFSQPDRTHIKDLLRSQGQEQAVSALEQHEEAAAKAAEAAREAARQSTPAPTASPASSLMEQMQQREEARRQEWERQRQENEQRRQAAEAADRERRQREAEEYRQRQEEQQRRSQEQQQERTQRMQEQMANLSAGASGPTMVTEYRCSKCNKVVPDSIGAGGNCPHCGVYFEYTQSPGGQKQYASGSGGNNESYRINGRAIKGVVFLVILVCGGIAGLWKKINGG